MLRLDHVVFPVRDAGASLDFYQRVLGLPLVEAASGDDWGGWPWLMMTFALPRGGKIVLAALRGAPEPPASPLPPDVRHYGLCVAAPLDLVGWRRRLREAKVAFWEETHGQSQSIYFADPDGVVLEIATALDPDEAQASPAALEAVNRWLAAGA